MHHETLLSLPRKENRVEPVKSACHGLSALQLEFGWKKQGMVLGASQKSSCFLTHTKPSPSRRDQAQSPKPKAQSLADALCVLPCSALTLPLCQGSALQSE